MSKDAIVHVRTTGDRKKKAIQVAAGVKGYTLTRIVEEGIDIVLEKLEKRKAKA